MECVYAYTRKRRDFGRHPTFSQSGPDLIVNILPNRDQADKFFTLPYSSVGVQCAPEQSEHEANTERFSAQSHGMQHKEGGWPKDIDPNEIDQRNMYQRKVERDDAYIASVQQLAGATEPVMRQNNALDIYEDYFGGTAEEARRGDVCSAREVVLLRDPNAIRRSARCICFHPDERNHVAVAYCVLRFQGMPRGVSLDSYVWDLQSPNTPESKLLPSSPITALQFNMKDPRVIVGGCLNGVVAFWDLRKGSGPVDQSVMEKCHRDPVYKVQWLQSKTGTECASVSTDGRVLWWDMRKANEPMEALELVNKLDGVRLAGVSMDYAPELGPSKFMVGTEEGIALSCNRKGKSQADKIAAPYPGHHGPVYAVQRNPVHTRYFLTVGDWTARVWYDDVRAPIMMTPYDSCYLRAGCWSPTRAGVFFTAKQNGQLAVWDMLLQEKCLEVKVSDSGLRSIECHSSGKWVAAGTTDGDVALFELSDALAVAPANEKAAILQVFERETKREKNFDTRAREQRLKEQKEKQQQKAGTAAPEFEGAKDLTEAEMKAIEEEFQAALGADPGEGEGAAGGAAAAGAEGEHAEP